MYCCYNTLATGQFISMNIIVFHSSFSSTVSREKRCDFQYQYWKSTVAIEVAATSIRIFEAGDVTRTCDETCYLITLDGTSIR